VTARDAKIVFTPSGRRGTFPHGTPLLDAARSIGVDVDSVCGGRGLCGRCRIVCTEGEFAKHAIVSRADHLSPLNDVERRYAGRRGPLSGKDRLSCQALIRGDLVIDVPPESQMHRQVVRKSAEHRDITLDPATRLYHVEVQPADLLEPSGDLDRLYEALAWEWQLTGLDCDTSILPVLQSALREGGWRVTVAIHRQSTVVATTASTAATATLSHFFMPLLPSPARCHRYADALITAVSADSMAASMPRFARPACSPQKCSRP